MTVVFRSCLPRFSSDTNQSVSNDESSENSITCLSTVSNENITTNSQLNCSNENQGEVLTSANCLKTRKRGPRYTRINEKPPPLLTRLVGTIFGDYGSVTKRKKQRSKKVVLPSKSKIEKQFENNEQTLHSLVALLAQIESADHCSSEEERARNNNRIDDASSNDSCPHRPKRANRKKGQAESDCLSSHYLFPSSRKMIDNEQQTQLYPTKITIGTSTHLTEPSWFDVMREDQTTINAWTRIRRRLKPHEQKDILRALMIICANLFDVSLENKHV